MIQAENPNKYNIPATASDKAPIVAADPQYAKKFATESGLNFGGADSQGGNPATPETPEPQQVYVVKDGVQITEGVCTYMQDVNDPEIDTEHTFPIGPAILRHSLDGKGQIIRLDADPDCWDDSQPVPDGQVVIVLDGQILKSTINQNGTEITVSYVQVIGKDPATGDVKEGYVAVAVTGIPGAEHTAFLAPTDPDRLKNSKTYSTLSGDVRLDTAAG